MRRKGMRGPHPRQEPRLKGELSPENLERVFFDCADFEKRLVYAAGGPVQVTVYWLAGMASTERLNDYVLRPLAQERRLAGARGGQLMQLLTGGALYAQQVEREDSLDRAAQALIDGACVLFVPDCPGTAAAVPVATEEKRSVGEPDNEPSLKGARDSFVESVRTNTSLVRRRLRAPELKIVQHTVGRQSLTPVDVLWLAGIADPDTVGRVRRRLDGIDIDGVESAGDLEEYLVDRPATAFPMTVYTQRPDRFCQGLLEGHVGVLCDGLALGYLLPGTVEQFFLTGQDRAYGWMLASMLRAVRYVCAGLTVLLPGLYIALVTCHPEAIPPKLALAMAQAKAQVPFSTVFEVLVMLFSFEVLQEAGLRLPAPVGATVSILGGLVVGSAAVDAGVVSPAVLMTVAIAGVAGYTVPSQDLAGALRLWRFALAVLASVGGLFGLWAGYAALLHHLARLESFGVPYLAPFTSGAGTQGRPDVLRIPLKWLKFRPAAPRNGNRRNQR